VIKIISYVCGLFFTLGAGSDVTVERLPFVNNNTSSPPILGWTTLDTKFPPLSFAGSSYFDIVGLALYLWGRSGRGWLARTFKLAIFTADRRDFKHPSR
jgi:hypothetical protein